MTNKFISTAFRRCIDRLLRTVDDDPDFPTPDKLALIKQKHAEGESPSLLDRQLLLVLEDVQNAIAHPTLLRAAIRIQSDFPDDFIGDDVNRIEEKLRTGRPSLRTKYWKQIIEASMDDDLGLGRPLPNYAVGPMGYNPLAHAIKKGAQLVVSVPTQYGIVPIPKVDDEPKPSLTSVIHGTLFWVAVILCVRAIKFLSNS
jgi:hypothetical protein